MVILLKKMKQNLQNQIKLLNLSILIAYSLPVHYEDPEINYFKVNEAKFPKSKQWAELNSIVHRFTHQGNKPPTRVEYLHNRVPTYVQEGAFNENGQSRISNRGFVFLLGSRPEII